MKKCGIRFLYEHLAMIYAKDQEMRNEQNRSI